MKERNIISTHFCRIRDCGGAKDEIHPNTLKYVSIICGVNFEIVAITRPCITFFSFRWRFKALTE